MAVAANALHALCEIRRPRSARHYPWSMPFRQGLNQVRQAFQPDYQPDKGWLESLIYTALKSWRVFGKDATK